MTPMTHDSRPFDVLFLTNFSDACFRAIPAVAQMCDVLETRLTIVHAYQPGNDVRGRRTATAAPAQLAGKLNSFFPEADAYRWTRRVLLPGTPLEAVSRLRRDQAIDLLIAPQRDALGAPRLGRHSWRSQLVLDGRTPVWTVGHVPGLARLARRARHVACCVDLHPAGRHHLKLACDYAAATGSMLHVIYMLPDEIHEGLMLTLGYAEPFDREQALAEVRAVVDQTPLMPEVHVSDRSSLAGLVTDLELDAVFVDGRRWTNRSWFGRRMNRGLESLGCAVFCVDANRDSVSWNLQPHATPTLAAPALPAPTFTATPALAVTPPAAA